MKVNAVFHKPIGVSYGLGFISTVGLIGIMSSLFILWSLSCLGGAACELASRFL